MPIVRRIGIGAAACLLLVSIGAADYIAGPEIAFALFYLVVIALTAWYGGSVGLTLTCSIVAAAAWLTAEHLISGTSSSTVLLWNAATRLVIFVTTGLLIVRLKRALDLARTLARTDYLTGALNARALDEVARLEVSRARRYNHPLTVAYLDLDDFKRINDRYGHNRGDEVLRAVSGGLRASLRRTDTIARIGGDEFVVLLPETGQEQAEDVLAKLQRALAEAMREACTTVTFSIGAAVFDVPPADVDALLKAADATMYAAKADGKNRYRISIERPAVERTTPAWSSPSG